MNFDGPRQMSIAPSPHYGVISAVRMFPFWIPECEILFGCHWKLLFLPFAEMFDFQWKSFAVKVLLKPKRMNTQALGDQEEKWKSTICFLIKRAINFGRLCWVFLFQISYLYFSKFEILLNLQPDESFNFQSFIRYSTLSSRGLNATTSVVFQNFRVWSSNCGKV